MPSFANLMNVLLGYGARAEKRQGAGYRRPTATLSYGEHPLQALDLHLLPGAGARPLIVFLHGGAWQFGDKARQVQDAKVHFAHAEGWHFAAANFRQVPEVSVYEMAQDAAAAVAELVTCGRDWGIDPSRIVVMGHSSGAHLTALLASDPALLGAHDISPTSLGGVILNDGAAYLASAPSTGSATLRKRLLDPAFGGADLDQLSPVIHARRAEGLPPALILHAATIETSQQAIWLEDAWREGSGQVERHGFRGKGAVNHMRLSRKLGVPRYAPTEAARKWLKERHSSSFEDR